MPASDQMILPSAGSFPYVGQMKKLFQIILPLAVSILISLQSKAQKKEVMAVVQSVFDGMAENDGDKVIDAFTEDAQSFTVFVNKENEVQKRSGSIQKFAEAVDKEKEKSWNEPIWNEKVQIDGGLASVWVDYAFYLGNEFHHCGVDAFHLLKTPDGWKIFHLVDTRRTEDCEVPKKIKSLYKE